MEKVLFIPSWLWAESKLFPRPSHHPHRAPPDLSRPSQCGTMAQYGPSRCRLLPVVKNEAHLKGNLLPNEFDRNQSYLEPNLT
jgi:hypothetical protein